ncbi:sensor histidine kinase [Gulosibacter molinativorax]|uniref:histidine kinase n=1 Tax=Gulosibacter molinativorax TaxID=256821 RepID=A0ABT7C9B8_9MICO|nr:HAMP domain-containing sensor histidine kinase [Gulosibacter molinativorax]MDJ1371814.1 sensor histidine kinase [Gulosibacter molinativorax]QUY60814.1 Two-component sensor histidine kinase [Gulosibacter molinativorax]
MLGLVAVFAIGVAVYASFAFDLELPETTEEALNQANVTLRTVLVVCFIAFVVVVPPLSYLLARHTLAPVRANLEAQQQFVDDASHELQTPIAVAQGELELALLQPRRPEQYQESITAALGALDELGRLTRDLLILAREDGVEDAREVIDLAELGERALLACPPETRARVRLRQKGSDRFVGILPLLSRAIGNLLENSAKFSPASEPIELLLERDGEVVRISVSDHGRGMSAVQASRAFDRFWRADNARSTPGRGIGLSIVRRVAELHGGRAFLRSEPGHGTVVTIEIPVTPAS